MMTEKLQFTFEVVAAPGDKKTNVIAITSIRTCDKTEYILPQEMMYVSEHEGLKKTEVYKRVRKSLTHRKEQRTVWITITEDLKKIYFDEEGNIIFKDFYLEQVIEEQNKIERVRENTNRINLKNITEKLMIEKFSCRNSNAKQWIETFEKECRRNDINEDINKIEILRLFLEKTCLDWHASTLIVLTVEAQWEEWKEKFIDTFADKGWSTGMYAIAYRYKEGSLMEYAIKKEKLLLDMDNKISTQTLVMLIAAGLPEFIRNKIDKEKCECSSDLLHEIKKCENLIRKANPIKKKEENKKKFEEKKPCTICEKLNKGTRYHLEDSCWFNKNSNVKEKKIIESNSTIEVDLNEHQKNE